MTRLLNLTAKAARLVLAPELGGAIAYLDVDSKPVLRPWTGDISGSPFDLASNILVPFSNRLSGGGFNWNGTRYAIVPNVSFEALPIHGDGFQKPWDITSHSDGAATLHLNNGQIGPFRYTAQQVFTLTPTGLHIDLSMTNTGPEPLPFGYGFHPWFPRDGDTSLAFTAKGVWMEDDDNLPTDYLELSANPDWDFSADRPLPDHLIDNPWGEWAGTARITQGAANISVDITASEALNHAIVYSKGADCDFICFEPVSQAINAHNDPDLPGLKILNPGETMSDFMQLTWNP